MHPLAAPTSPNTHPGTGGCLWRDVPQDTQLLTRVHTLLRLYRGEVALTLMLLQKTGSLVVMGKRGPNTCEAR